MWSAEARDTAMARASAAFFAPSPTTAAVRGSCTVFPDLASRSGSPMASGFFSTSSSHIFFGTGMAFVPGATHPEFVVLRVVPL